MRTEEITAAFNEVTEEAKLNISKFLNAFNPYLSEAGDERDLLVDVIDRDLHKGSSEEAGIWRERIADFINKSWENRT